MSEVNPGVVPYEVAKLQWQTFEQRDDRFPFPRKNYQYVTRIVNGENNSPEAVQRGLDYFDSLGMWLLRAEGYQHLAGTVAEEAASKIARSVFDFSQPLLVDAPLHGDFSKYTMDAENGTRTFENVLSLINWAVVHTQDDDLITTHRRYLTNNLVAYMQSKGATEDEAAFALQYYTDQFESQLSPESYCAYRKTNEAVDLAESGDVKFVGCVACHGSFWQVAKSLEPIGENLCLFPAD